MRVFDLGSSALAASMIFACLGLSPAQTGASSQQQPAPGSGSKQEIGGKVYRDWLNQDVVWIITPEERKAFKKLTSNDERDRFIDQFWFRRNPEPGSGRNPFKEEHYRRIAYSNVHFADSRPGWKTDRGHVYIVHGRPDSVDSHPESFAKHAPEDGGGASDYPYEIWRYRHLDGVGDNIEIKFIDECRCGDYNLVADPSR